MTDLIEQLSRDKSAEQRAMVERIRTVLDPRAHGVRGDAEVMQSRGDCATTRRASCAAAVFVSKALRETPARTPLECK